MKLTDKQKQLLLEVRNHEDFYGSDCYGMPVDGRSVATLERTGLFEIKQEWIGGYKGHGQYAYYVMHKKQVWNAKLTIKGRNLAEELFNESSKTN
jgi:hypothetical protein